MRVLGFLILPVLIAAVVVSVASMDKQDISKQPCNSDENVRIYNVSTGQVETVKRVCKTDDEWKKLLTPEQYEVTRLRGTERPFSQTCSIPGHGESGIYECVGCGTDLFKYDTKFESGTGWPSFYDPVSELNVRQVTDESHGMLRTEVVCARCAAHLGHVFDDGPPPTHKRFCINTVALKLAPVGKHEVATFAAGCFWGVESGFRELIGKGVISTKVGFIGGHTKNPSYKEVCTRATGHAEAVEVVFDPSNISYEKLLDLFWEIHDPTTPNRQGPDIGDQYRSGVFYHTPEQKRIAEESRERLAKSDKLREPIVTEITQAGEFYPAEDYHQQYNEKRGLAGACHIR